MLDLFNPIVDKSKLHPNFLNTTLDSSSGVRKVLQDWADGFVDRDGKFIKEFQTTYNSSFWELYLFAVLKKLNIAVDFSRPFPDFVCKELIIEAAIANHGLNDSPEWAPNSETLKEDLFENSKHTVIRLSNAFTSKLQKYRSSYCHFDNVKNKPYIIAIGDFSERYFSLHGDVAMQWLLYDVLENKTAIKNNGAEVPLGLFNSDRFSDVSAILYSSLATFGKARALSDENGNFEFHAVRIRNNYELIKVTAKKSEYKESLLDGLRLFINPFAINPIQLSDFDDAGIRIFVPDKDGLLISCHPEGDLYMRFVIRQTPKG